MGITARADVLSIGNVSGGTGTDRNVVEFISESTREDFG